MKTQPDLLDLLGRLPEGQIIVATLAVRKAMASPVDLSYDELFFRLGTLPPLRRASDRPIAIACFRLFTFLPERPDLRVPCFRLCIARLTLLDALGPYFLRDDLAAMIKILLAAKRRNSEKPAVPRLVW